MVVLAPIEGSEVVVEDGVAADAHVVPAPVDAGGSFVAVVRGAGVRVTATAVPSMGHVFQELEVS